MPQNAGDVGVKSIERLEDFAPTDWRADVAEIGAVRARAAQAPLPPEVPSVGHESTGLKLRLSECLPIPGKSSD